MCDSCRRPISSESSDDHLFWHSLRHFNLGTHANSRLPSVTLATLLLLTSPFPERFDPYEQAHQRLVNGSVLWTTLPLLGGGVGSPTALLTHRLQIAKEQNMEHYTLPRTQDSTVLAVLEAYLESHGHRSLNNVEFA